jgi:DNA-binding NarL/FixJ family response regulator
MPADDTALATRHFTPYRRGLMPSQNTQTILLADDHSIVRAGLREALEAQPGWTICGEASNGRDAIRMARDLAPDIMILDISMPDLSGVIVARDIRKLKLPTELLIFTMHDSEQLVREVLSAGARGFVLKSATTETIVTAVTSLLNHKPYFCPGITDAVLRGYLSPGVYALGEVIEGSESLTTRELLIVQLLAESHSNKVIASMLDISVKTVESHRGNIMRKLGAHSLADIVRYAIRNKLIEA